MAKSVMDSIALSRSSSLELYAQGQRVKFMHGSAIPAVRALPRVLTPPSLSQPVSSPKSAPITEAQEPPRIASADSLPFAQPSSSNTPTSSKASGSKGTPRGRRLNFLRKRSSEKPSLSSRGGRPDGQAALPERPEQHEGACLYLVNSVARPLTRVLISLVKPCLKKVSSSCGSLKIAGKSHSASLPTPRTNPYDAPYFFPTPLSPEANGYIDRVRMDRSPSHSPESVISAFPGSKSAISPPLHIEFVTETQTTFDGHVSSGEGSVDEEGFVARGPTRRVLSFSSHQSVRPRRNRPTSWGSEAPTLDTSRSVMSFESINPPSMPLPTRRLTRLWR